MSTKIQKNITLPQPLASDLALKANQVGLSISEYVRILIYNDTKDLREASLKLSKDSERAVAESYKAFDNGEYIVLDSKEKKDKFLKGR